MDLKDKLISSFWAFDGHKDDDAYLQNIRTEAIKSFKEKGFPTKKEEAWKYTSLNRLLKNDFSVFSRKENSLEYRDVKKYFIHEIDSYKIVFIDGKYSSHLSQTTHEGIDVCLMSSALTKPKYRIFRELETHGTGNAGSPGSRLSRLATIKPMKSRRSSRRRCCSG